MTKSLVPVMERYPSFKKANKTERKHDVWYSWIEPVLEASFKEYLRKFPNRASNLRQLPNLEYGINSVFPEMKGDTQAHEALRKSISAHYNCRKKKGSTLEKQLQGLRLRYGSYFVSLFKPSLSKKSKFKAAQMNCFTDVKLPIVEEVLNISDSTESLPTITLVGEGVNITRTIEIDKFKELLAAHY